MVHSCPNRAMKTLGVEGSCFLSMQPVFDREREVFAREAAYACLGLPPGPERNMAGFTWLVGRGLDDLTRLTVTRAKLFVPVPAQASGMPEIGCLPWDNTVLLVEQNENAGEQFIEDCQAIKTSGYGLGLCFSCPPREIPELWEIADVVCADFASLTREEFLYLKSRFEMYPGKLLARGIATWEQSAAALELGADLIAGTFFGRPEIVAGRDLQAGLLARLELMRILRSEDYSYKDVAKVLAKDAFLAFRLLRTVNSPAMGQRGVRSIEHAVALLGFESFKQWAMTTLVASLDASARGEELAYFSLLRAQFLMRLAENVPDSPFAPGSMFLLGLLSLLDALIGRPMDELVAGIPMDAGMAKALCRRGGPALAWLDMLSAVDANRWDEAKAFFHDRGIGLETAARAYIDASRWARECFDAGKRAAGEEEPGEE